MIKEWLTWTPDAHADLWCLCNQGTILVTVADLR